MIQSPSPSAIELELAGFASWPAFEQVDHQGSILRFADGYTKRANSANRLTIVGEEMEENVLFCEAFYRERSQPSIFRLTSCLNDQRFDSYLIDRGYHFLDSSLILGRSLVSMASFSGKDADFVINNDRSVWLKAYCEISRTDLNMQSAHAKILHRIGPVSLFTTLLEEGKEVACGLGVIQDGLFGIFDIMTIASCRNAGYGTRLLEGMLSWAKRQGACYAYAQVVASNASAIRLYEKLGYRRLYDYWYRKKEVSSPDSSRARAKII